MNDKQTKNASEHLNHRATWLAVGIGLVAMVVYLSLANLQLPVLPSTFNDKVNHVIAYGTLMGWFGQLYKPWKIRFIIAAALIALGIVMEFMQGATDHRVFEWLDACANTLGVMLGALALAAGADKILLWFEAKITVKA